MLKSVLITARPPAGTMVFSADDKSNPADCGEPRVGILACSDRNLLCSIYIVVVVHVYYDIICLSLLVVIQNEALRVCVRLIQMKQ